MRSADIPAHTSVADPQLSPDGTQVAYVLHRVDEKANTYSSQIWVAATDGLSAPRALTAGEHRDSSPRWSPDGTSLAFASSRKKDNAGKTLSTLHLLPFASPGETVLLAEHDESFGELAWSPDGTLLAVTARVRGDHYEHDEVSRRPPRRITSLFTMLNGEGSIADRPQHVHLVAVDGSCPMRDVTPGPWQCSQPAWTPAGDQLAVSIDRFQNTLSAEIALVPVDSAKTGEVADEFTGRLLTDHSGYYLAPLPMPNGTQILVMGSDDPRTYPKNDHLGLLDIDTVGSPDWRSTALDRTWAPIMAQSRPTLIDADRVLAGVEDRGNVHLRLLTLSTGESELVVSGDLSVTGWSTRMGADLDVLAWTATTATAPAELFVRVDGTDRQLTNHTSRFVNRVEPRAPEHFIATSGEVEVDAWLITPHDFDPAKQYPMLLNVHGGPFTQYGNFFMDQFQMQARAGYVVLYCNPRGGSGRTTAWGQAIIGPKHPVAPGKGWGSVDYDDCMAAVDAALERFDFIDPDRLGMLGGSYGGYMALWIATHTDRFKAICAERSASNMLTIEHSSDIGGFFHSELGPLFPDDPDEFRRMSPTTYLKDMDTPLLLIHSDEDLRCPPEQAWQVFNACTLLGKDVEFVLFPGETHELSRSGSPIHLIQRADLIHEFFDRRLNA